MPKRKTRVVAKQAAVPSTGGQPDFFRFGLIVCATFLVYLPALGGGLLWDDTSHLTRPDLQPLHGLWRIWFELGATQQYYPLLHSVFWLEHLLWGDATLGYHLLTVALHATAACLVVLIVRRLQLQGAWVAGALFALHPIAAEAVAWISEQKSTLSAVFYLAAGLIYLDFDESRRPARYWMAFLLFLLALASKTVTATLPAVLLVVLWWRRGKLELRRDIGPLGPWLGVGAFAGLFTAWVERTLIGANGTDFLLTPPQRMLLAARVIWFYAVKIVLPIRLMFLYPRWRPDPGEWWQYLFPAGVLVVAIFFWRLAGKNRGPMAGLLIFAGTLFPVLGFFNVYPFRYAYVADHFTYLASLAILVPAASMCVTRLPRFGTAAILLALGVLTFLQAGIYRDSEALYRASIARNPDAWLAHNNLGVLLYAAGRRDDAMAEYREALRANPDYWEAHLSLGNAFLGMPGRLDDALAEYRTAERLEPNSQRTRANLGKALLRAGQIDEAIVQLHAALKIQPGNSEAHCDLATALTRVPGRMAEAEAEYRTAIRYNPENAEAHNDLGHILTVTPGRLPEAIAEFQAAIRIMPEFWEAHTNLGTALSGIPGQIGEAIIEFQAAARIRPIFAPSHINLGDVFAQIPERWSEAAAEYRRAVQLAPASAEAHYDLASILVRQPGERAQALAEFEAGLRLRRDPQVEQMVARLRATLK